MCKWLKSNIQNVLAHNTKQWKLKYTYTRVYIIYIYIVEIGSRQKITRTFNLFKRKQVRALA